MEYPIAEIFYSIQGEGGHSGMPMLFLRLAGCTVGKPYTQEEKAKNNLYVFQNQCTIYDGRQFACDTDYRMAIKMNISGIVSAIREILIANKAEECRWVSITGGEPLMHDITPLCSAITAEGYDIHLETSGTIPADESLRTVADYIVVSPKFPFRKEYGDLADEFRLLIDQDFNWNTVPEEIKDQPEKTWISPIGTARSLLPSNVEKCVAIATANPGIRVSLQIHKILKVR